MTPKGTADISVCVATYNSEQTLRVCLDSIFRQTIEPGEVLVCDGGSRDGTLEILKEYPVKIIATDVEGVGSARNVLASAASGRIVAWVDSDIAIPVNWLELREKIHKEHPKIVCLSSSLPVLTTEEADRRYKIPISLPIDVNPSKRISQSALTIKRELVRKVEGYDPFFEWGEDWDLTIRLLRMGAGLYWTETCLAYHMREKKFMNWTPRELILGGNFMCFLSKYGQWYIKFSPLHFAAFLLRLWLLYSLLGLLIFPLLALISLSLAGITNLIASKIYHKTLRPGYLLEQILKALGEHRNLFRSIFHRRKHHEVKL